jgi:hypothetical protein
MPWEKTSMYLLRIEHPIPDYDGWKAAFDSDPIDRAASGVTAFRISRPIDNDRYILVDLEFPTQEQAEAALAKLEDLWTRVDVVAGGPPQTRILRVSEDGTP